MKYLVKFPITSRVHGRLLSPGEEIEFPENPTPDAEGNYPEGAILVDIPSLIKNEALEPVEEETPPARVGKSSPKKDETEVTDNGKNSD